MPTLQQDEQKVQGIIAKTATWIATNPVKTLLIAAVLVVVTVAALI